MRALEDDPRRRHGQLLADAWCAAFMQPKTAETAGAVVTTRVLRRIADAHPERIVAEEQEELFDLGTPAEPVVAPEMRDSIAEQAARYRFFHWHLEFPHLFPVPEAAAQAGPQGWDGGFSCIFGNPPWERVNLKEQEFFAAKDPDLAGERNASVRKASVDSLEVTGPDLWNEWRAALRESEASNLFLRRSDRFPYCGRGSVNTYSAFAEAMRDLIDPAGRAGVVTPTGLGTDASNAPFIADCVSSGRLAAFLDFENRLPLFPGVDTRFRFAITQLTGRTNTVTEILMAFRLVRPEQVASQSVFMTNEDIRRMNPNTGTLPVFESERDAEITRGIYRRCPVIFRDNGDSMGNPWSLQLGRMFHLSDDSHLFMGADQLEALGANFDGWSWRGGAPDSTSGQAWLPLYEAKLLDIYDHRAATYSGASGQSIPSITDGAHDDPTVEPQARYWIPAREVEHAAGDRRRSRWLLGWRDITNSTNERTIIPCVMPFTAVGNSFSLISLGRGEEAAPLQAALSALALDYVARRKITGTHANHYLLKQIACPTPETFAATPPWIDESLGAWVRPRVLELTYTSYRIAPYAEDLGDVDASGRVHEPFRWIPDRRFGIRAELDAAMLHVYGLTRPEAEHVLDSFPVLRKYEEAPPEKGGYGEFRTKRMVLELYDQMAEAAATGTPWRSPLDPPPGSGPRHPARS
jgi:hypothetical protein